MERYQQAWCLGLDPRLDIAVNVSTDSGHSKKRLASTEGRSLQWQAEEWHFNQEAVVISRVMINYGMIDYSGDKLQFPKCRFVPAALLCQLAINSTRLPSLTCCWQPPDPEPDVWIGVPVPLLLAVWSYINKFIFLCLIFLICKLDIKSSTNFVQLCCYGSIWFLINVQ